MLMLYHFYRQTELDGIILFAFLSCILYILSAPKNKFLSIRKYTLLSTLTYALCYTPVQQLHLIPFTPVVYGQLSPYWYYFFCTIVISLLWAHFLLQTSFVSKFTYVLFFMAFIQLYKIVCQPLYLQEGRMDANLYCLLDLLTSFFLYLLLFLLALLFKRLKLSSTIRLLPRRSFFALYFPVSFLLYYAFLTNTKHMSYDDPILAVIILTNLPIIYYLLSHVIQAYEEQRRLDSALTQTKSQLARYRFSLELEEQLKKERHELKNNYFYIQTLLKEKKYERLDIYLEKMIGENLSLMNLLQTGNTLMDYILNRKIKEAHKYHIKIYTEIIVPEHLSIDDDILCTILLNLIDNAIEASKNEEAPDIHLTMKCSQSYLICKISNKISHDILALNPNLHTTKTEQGSHGLGIKIVSNAVQKCSGIFNYTVEEGYFNANVMLPLDTNFNRSTP
ncbi:sensor histidine kinase [Konateibacter massiliensis]|uniref:sensor histidine kinase n=1 Tax=Konateibacter massiliensis TaxID=2002841 RepID=UPI000C1501F9|nr:sensor histidine kinase [Konateibacter massiliensis]